MIAMTTPTAPTASAPVQPAGLGLAVNAIASTPSDVAVGGTDFNDPNPFTYFSNTNNATTATHNRFMTPVTKSSVINAQQQPMQ